MKSGNPQIRRSQRVIRMVSELHRMGYQRLRVMPYEGALGAWRLSIGPRNLFSPVNGALMVRGEAKSPRYSSADGNQFFGWADCQSDDARALAEKFVERFPKIALTGRGRDWEYSGWLSELIGHLEQGDLLPVVISEEIEKSPMRLRRLPIIDYGAQSRRISNFPLPPTRMTQ